MEQNAVKVSVIIPVYNVEQYLRECMESILNQTLAELELICVDDGSTDGSLEILREYEKKDSRVIVLTQDNLGGGAARNQGLAIARGKYLSLLDSDDFFDPHMLEFAYKQCKCSDAQICVYQVQRYEDTTGKTWLDKGSFKEANIPEKEVFSYKDMPDFILNTFQNWAWNKLISRKLVEENHIRFQEIHRTNDFLFVASCMVKAERITVLRKALVNYRVGMKNSCQSTNYRYPLDFLNAFEAVRQMLKEQGIYELVEKSYVNHALSGSIYNLNSIQDLQAKERLYRELKTDAFEKLGIKGKPADYFEAYNKKNYQACQFILDHSLEEYLEWNKGSQTGKSAAAKAPLWKRVGRKIKNILG